MKNLNTVFYFEKLKIPVGTKLFVILGFKLLFLGDIREIIQEIKLPESINTLELTKLLALKIYSKQQKYLQYSNDKLIKVWTLEELEQEFFSIMEGKWKKI